MNNDKDKKNNIDSGFTLKFSGDKTYAIDSIIDNNQRDDSDKALNLEVIKYDALRNLAIDDLKAEYGVDRVEEIPGYETLINNKISEYDKKHEEKLLGMMAVSDREGESKIFDKAKVMSVLTGIEKDPGGCPSVLIPNKKDKLTIEGLKALVMEWLEGKSDIDHVHLNYVDKIELEEILKLYLRLSDFKEYQEEIRDIIDVLNEGILDTNTKVQDLNIRVEHAEDKIDQFEKDMEDAVFDPDYVHTDNNYTDPEKEKVSKIDIEGNGDKFLSDDGTYKPLDASGQIGDHNEDPNAHQDIRDLIDTKLNSHNQSAEAHKDLRDILKTRIGIPTYDSATHTFTFTAADGATVSVDLPIETIGLTYDAVNKTIDFTDSTGVVAHISIADLVDTYVGSIGSEIQISVDKGNVIRAKVLETSINIDKLTTDLQDLIKDKYTKAEIDEKITDLDTRKAEDNEVVKKIEQSLNDEEKLQAKRNIGAEKLSQLENDIYYDIDYEIMNQSNSSIKEFIGGVDGYNKIIDAIDKKKLIRVVSDKKILTCKDVYYTVSAGSNNTSSNNLYFSVDIMNGSTLLKTYTIQIYYYFNGTIDTNWSYYNNLAFDYQYATSKPLYQAKKVHIEEIYGMLGSKGENIDIDVIDSKVNATLKDNTISSNKLVPDLANKIDSIDLTGDGKYVLSNNGKYVKLDIGYRTFAIADFTNETDGSFSLLLDGFNYTGEITDQNGEFLIVEKHRQPNGSIKICSSEPFNGKAEYIIFVNKEETPAV